MQISRETPRHEPSHMKLHCMQQPLIVFGSEPVKRNILNCDFCLLSPFSDITIFRTFLSKCSTLYV